MSIFENMTLPPCIWFEGGDKRNAIVAMLSGILFFSGWWIIIDVASVYPSDLPKASHVCGVLATVSFFLVNTVSNAQVRGDTYSGGCLGPRGARLWLFAGFVIGFASIIATCWILFANFVPIQGKNTWSAVGLFLQNALIFTSSLLFKFGRTEDLWG